ncbi:pickpocket protein 28 [Drosophila eugracilis]|uniref:pickpocket protein 28 n=1 Tax=Drosophila eugracilis TaxID=29029 RepID=UPI0007E78C54|nr:pickpocket protein 28 [Drosophila eugracilis]XP_017077680.1 pickpocket protein 28 [Drosophila eugracilis]
MELSASTRPIRQGSSVFLLKSLVRSLRQFLNQTSLHGLKFVGDSSLSSWERSFFFGSFVIALIITVHLISNIYVKWDSTPVIIGISPHATSILKVPFPAITICNMNQVQKSQVAAYREGSDESALLQLLCDSDSWQSNKFDEELAASNFDRNNLRISDFVSNHSQSCERMLLFCRFSAVERNCSHLFQQILTDEGLCCVFNFQPPEHLYKPYSNNRRNLTSADGFETVKWDPETGYPEKLPPKYHPAPSSGTGITLGFTAVLNAEMSEYYCSSTNGPGFKVYFHNPIEVPMVKEAGLITAIGYETNYRIEMVRAEAVPAIRSISRDGRQCLFNDEKELIFYRIYTRLNCENECLAAYLYESCSCIPFDYPQIYSNASTCTMRDTFCVRRAQREAVRPGWVKCRKQCLPSCFDLNYLASGFAFPLATNNFQLANALVESMNKSYLSENIAVINVYFRESVYYGNTKNAYVGLTEFLSNVGGVMGLFMGFSVISLAEILYFLILRPISELFVWKRSSRVDSENSLKHNAFAIEQAKDSDKPISWLTRELYPKGVKLRSFERGGRIKGTKTMDNSSNH